MIEIFSHKPSAWLGKGHALHDLGRFNQAIRCFDRIFELDARRDVCSEAWSDKSAALYRMGRAHLAKESNPKATPRGRHTNDKWPYLAKIHMEHEEMIWKRVRRV